MLESKKVLPTDKGPKALAKTIHQLYTYSKFQFEPSVLYNELYTNSIYPYSQNGLEFPASLFSEIPSFYILF
jgi:hypothetical protein